MAHTKKAKTVKIKVTLPLLYQMRDSDGEDMGILKTNLPFKKVEKEWTKHYNDTDFEEFGVNIFVELMKKKYKATFYTFERVFCEATIYP